MWVADKLQFKKGICIVGQTKIPRDPEVRRGRKKAGLPWETVSGEETSTKLLYIISKDPLISLSGT